MNLGKCLKMFEGKLKLKNLVNFLLACFVVSVAFVGCGKKNETKNTPVPSNGEVALNEGKDENRCKIVTNATCVIPGDEGKCLAYTLTDRKECPEDK